MLVRPSAHALKGCKNLAPTSRTLLQKLPGSHIFAPVLFVVRQFRVEALQKDAFPSPEVTNYSTSTRTRRLKRRLSIFFPGSEKL